MEDSKDIILNILEEAIQLEMDGYTYYQKAAKESTDPFSKNLLTRLAEDEAEHRNIFLNYRDTINSKGSTKDVADKYINSLRDKSLKIFPSDPLVIKSEINRSDKNINLLNVAIEKEDKSIELYSDAQKDIADKEVKRFLNVMVNIEKQHKNILTDYMRFLKEPDAGWDDMERWACQT